MAEKKTSKGLHISLWVAQGLLAAAFGMAGFMKLTMPTEELVTKGMSFVNNYGVRTVRFIGIAEVLAAIGLILPSAFRILPKLTPLAALGLFLIQVLAIQYHVSHGESPIPNIILVTLAAFVAWGRFKKAPIQAKA